MDHRLAIRKPITMGAGLFILAFLLALSMRFFDLGRVFLSNVEAIPALQALGTAKGTRPLIGDQPGYTLLTSLLFIIFGSSEFLARFWPALIGSLVVWIPFQFRRHLGWPAAVVLAFCLALDPGLVATSRQADGLGMAVVFSLLAVGFFIDKKYPWVGISASLAILGGVGFWFGLLPAGLALIWSFYRRPVKPAQIHEDSDTEENQPPRLTWMTRLRTPLFWMLGTLIGAGTLFFFAPSGLGGVAEAITEYFSGWLSSSGITLFQVLLALLVYELMPLVFGTWGILSLISERDPVDLFLARWTLSALVFELIYPSREVTYLVWATIPLWALAARQAVRQLKVIDEEIRILIGYIALVFALIIFIWMSFVYVANNQTEAVEYRDRWIVILIAAVMIFLLVMLMRWGWGSTASTTGAFIAIGLALTIFTLSAAWNAGGLGRRPDTELWRKDPYPEDAGLLTVTIQNFYQWRGVDHDPISLRVVGIDEPSLRWTLRNFTDVSFSGEQATDQDQNPSMVITPVQENAQLPGTYTGESFIWEQQPAWMNLFPNEIEKWAVVRDIPVEKTSILLWVRSDLFPGMESAKTSQ
jgi:hypothetical protein